MRRIFAFILFVTTIICGLSASQDYAFHRVYDEVEGSVFIFPGVGLKKREGMREYLYLHEGMLHVKEPTVGADKHWVFAWEVYQKAIQCEIDHRSQL